MPDVVGVHGISQQQQGAEQLVVDWKPALVDGVRAALGHDPKRSAPTVDIGFYGDFFLPATTGGWKGPGDLRVKDENALADLHRDEVAWFDEVADELEASEAEGDVWAATAAAKGQTKAPRVARPVARLAGWLDHKFGAAAPLLFLSDLRQVRRYQVDDDLARRIRERVAEAHHDGCSVLVGHSLGSVVAYEVACLAPPEGLRMLVTLGSPLGLKTVRRRLRSAEPPMTPWVNVLDARDAVCCGGGLAEYWAAAEDRLVDNESQPHSVTRYLGKAATGEAVARGVWP